MADVEHLRKVRDKARAIGDRGLERAVVADLARYGVSPDESSPSALPTGQETATVALPDRAVLPPKRRGRPPRPRCEHGQILGRCPECDPYGDAA